MTRKIYLVNLIILPILFLLVGCPNPTGNSQSPTNESSIVLPNTHPFVDYAIQATQLFSGAASAYSWNVSGDQADQYLFDSSGVHSFSLSGEKSSTLTFTPTLCATYNINLSAITPSGIETRKAKVSVTTPGLTVELCWDKTGTADLDLHLHKSDASPWFYTSITGSTINTSDCYYNTGAAGNYSPSKKNAADWGYANSPLSYGQGEPNGASWSALGSCANPRLSIENINLKGKPEIINLDNPKNGDSFRIMVHYYGSTAGNTMCHPMLRVYCGGSLIYNVIYTDNDFNSAGSQAAGLMWRVADIQIAVTGGVVTGSATALHPNASNVGFRVTNNDITF